MSKAAEQVRQFILRNFPVARKRELELDAPLLESGIIDSLGVLTIVEYLSEQHQISIDEDDLSPENFRSIQSIADLIESKQAPGRGEEAITP